MAHSGVTVKDNCVDQFNEVKLKKTHMYLQFKITDDFEHIDVDKKGPGPSCSNKSLEERVNNFNDFVAQLPPKECRYAVYDFHFTSDEGGDRQKLVLVVWIPETAKIKNKMLYASSKDAIKKKLIGIAGEIQATEPSELDYNEVRDKIKQK